MTTGLDWIGRRITEISSESVGLGRTQERTAVIAYLNDLVANFEHKPVINVRQLIAQIAIDLGDGRHLAEGKEE